MIQLIKLIQSIRGEYDLRLYHTMNHGHWPCYFARVVCTMVNLHPEELEIPRGDHTPHLIPGKQINRSKMIEVYT